jgi:hypothetical protein
MTDTMKARLFDAMYGDGPAPDAETRRRAAFRVVSSEDGLTLIKAYNPCLRPVYNAKNEDVRAFTEGRRSMLLEIIRLATGEGERTGSF